MSVRWGHLTALQIKLQGEDILQHHKNCRVSALQGKGQEPEAGSAPT
jgi:hypothetical protein